MNLPHDIAAERAVLGAPFIVSAAMDAMVDLDAADFFQPVHRYIFESLRAVHKRGDRPDPLLISDEMRARDAFGKLDGGVGYLTTLASDCPSPFTIGSYVTIVAELSARRRLIIAAREMAAAAEDREVGIADTLDDARRKVAEIGIGGAARWMEFTNLIPAVLDDIQEREARFAETDSMITGLPFYVDGIDSVLLGMQRSDLGIVAADTSAGKTSLAMQAMIGHILHDGAGLVINMEMPAKQIAERAIVWRAKVDSRLVRAGKIAAHKRSLMMAGADLMATNCAVKDDINTMPKITSVARQWRAKTRAKAGMMIVDFAQLIRGANDKRMTRAQEVGTFAQELKSLAKELDIPIVLISQLNRVGVKADRPSKSDLKESGDLENAADWIIIVHNTAEEPKGDDPVMFYVDKNRNGARAQAPGWWTGRHYLFSDNQP